MGRVNRSVRALSLMSVLVVLLAGCGRLSLKDAITKVATLDPVWVLKDSKAVGPAGSWFGYSVEVSDTYVIVGAPASPEGGTNRGAAYIYTRNSDGTLAGSPVKIVSSSPANNLYFGAVVAITDSYAFVSSTGTNKIEVFSQAAGWSKVGPDLSISSGTVASAMDASGNYFVASDQAGRVRFFHNIAGTWTMEFPINGSAPDQYGWSVAICGDWAVVGAENYSGSVSDGGRAYVYQRSGTSWNLVKTLDPPVPTANGLFGQSVALTDLRMVVGTWATTSLHFCELSGSQWQADGSLSIGGVVAGDQFSSAVAVTGDSVIAGAYGTSSGRGCAYPAWRTDGTWASRKADKILTEPSGSVSANFGTSVAAHGNALVIGSPYSDNAFGTDAGAVYIYAY